MSFLDFHAINNLAPGAEYILRNNNYESLEWLSDDIEKPTEAALLAEQQRLDEKYPWDILRKERDRLLAETDWVVSRAVDASNDGLGIQLPQVWMDYRQALRDLPANTTDPANPVWPTKP